ncbi:MAG TPA: protein-glutamate O-methyltransferase CheR [Blastocatellia bacterium]|nr:protein-glutamate O-methyltransferase CheR [Blastocatellia bacterium]
MSRRKSDPDLEAIEIKLLLEGVYLHYGYDFREYAPASFKRRLSDFARSENLKSLSQLQDRILHDPACFERFIVALTVNVTAMFRDPSFYLAFRAKVVPMLKTYPFIRIWHAGCSTGEEVYSMAILLMEEGIYDRCRIYATDLNESVLKRAKDGIFPLQFMQNYIGNYLKAGGKSSLSEYYTANYDNAIFRSSLRDNIVFSQHNLVTDSSFNEFNVILCRNVLIYFNQVLQKRVHNLFYESLGLFGILGLGHKETISYSPHEERYQALEAGEKLYRRIA